MSNTKKQTTISNLNKLYAKHLKLNEIKEVSKEVQKVKAKDTKLNY